MNNSKLIIFPLLIFFFSSSKAQIQDGYLYVPIDQIIQDDHESQTISAWADGLIEFDQNDTSLVVGKWSAENPTRSRAIGKMVPTRIGEEGVKAIVFPDDYSKPIKEGDLIGLKLVEVVKDDKSIFYELSRMNVFFSDVYGENSYRFSDFFRNNNLGKSNELLDIYLNDIHFVAKAMVEQGMENQVVEGGRFDGEKLFDAMANSNLEDLADFLGYVQAKPLKYMGNTWKISETFATWIVSKTPTANDLLINWMLETVNNDSQEAGQSDCNGNALVLDLKKGTLNGFKPTISMDEVKEVLPCFTGETEEGQKINCNGGVFFLKNDFYFYTGNDYIEVRSGFSGKVSEDLLGKTTNEIEDILGKPDRVPIDESEDEYDFGFVDDIQYLYKRKYGALGLAFDPESKRVKKIAIHYRKIDEVEICW